jgi:hypothetical protein
MSLLQYSLLLLQNTTTLNNNNNNNNGGSSLLSLYALRRQQQQQQQRAPPSQPYYYVCKNEYNLPNEPDYGCTVEKPLCMIDDDVVEVVKSEREEESSRPPQRRRPPYGQGGTYCSDYPCSNTEQEDNNNNNIIKTALVVPDQGCTSTKPRCVNGLGRDPLPNEPGLYCTEDDDSRKGRMMDKAVNTKERPEPVVSVRGSSTRTPIPVSSKRRSTTTTALQYEPEQYYVHGDVHNVDVDVILLFDELSTEVGQESPPFAGGGDDNDELRCLISGLTMPPIVRRPERSKEGGDHQHKHKHTHDRQQQSQQQQQPPPHIDYKLATFACSACPVTSSCKLGQSLGW